MVYKCYCYGMSTNYIPDMKLSFNDDDFSSGFAVYDKNGRPYATMVNLFI